MSGKMGGYPSPSARGPGVGADSTVSRFGRALIAFLLVFSASGGASASHHLSAIGAAAREPLSTGVDGSAPPVPRWAPQEQPEGPRAILARVHSGDSKHRPALEKNTMPIYAWVNAANSDYRIDPAAFSSNLEPLAEETGGPRQKSRADAAVSDPDLFAIATTWLWYVLLSAALLIAMVLFLLLALWIRRALRDNLTSTRPSRAVHSLAFLESQDGSGQRHAVTSATYRIGRHSDNHLSIHDSSVSRQHAEISLRPGGSFTITDLDSMNGVFVNQKKIDAVILADGDIVEIGDKSFRFRMREQR